MPPYESESSDEGEDYTETNVLLGYATKDATGDAISHIGGTPVRTHPCAEDTLLTAAELDRRQDGTLWRARQVQSVQRPAQPAARAERRSPRPLPRPRAATVHLELSAQGLQEEGGKRAGHPWRAHRQGRVQVARKAGEEGDQGGREAAAQDRRVAVRRQDRRFDRAGKPLLQPLLHERGHCTCKSLCLVCQRQPVRRACARICARSTDQLDAVETAIHAANPAVRVHKLPVDVSSDAAVAALAAQIAAKESRLDVLVNNAGYSAPWVPMHESDPAEWWRTLEVNLKGPFLLTQALLPLLLKTAEQTGYVDVVNMASIGAHVVNPVASSYMLSKLALCRLTEKFDAGYAAKGVNVVSLNPGGVVTAMSSQELEILGPYLNDTPELCGGFAVWLTAEPRKWAGGRYLSATWDVDALSKLSDEIVKENKLKVKLAV
ncbi:hypothetical protein OPT61_g9845 [Boeremia exigua]|uniref:Uncharacterized protein n=1 Tax=Boeremia exigua TaxID=749465 RepID=A0ACC2HSC7_9PLEO|nr:hypothetical protein OPT61_g9845 [Boeremia exigua]